MHLHTQEPTCATDPTSTPGPATCSMGPFSEGSVLHSLGADMWAAVLSVHYEHSWGFVCGEEKSYLSKPWRKKSPTLCRSVRRDLGQVIVVCECCHVLHCKWLLVAFCCVKQVHNQMCFILLPCILVHWLLLACRSWSTLMNNLQDCNTLSKQLNSGTLFNYFLFWHTFPFQSKTTMREDRPYKEHMNQNISIRRLLSINPFFII